MDTDSGLGIDSEDLADYGLDFPLDYGLREWH